MNWMIACLITWALWTAQTLAIVFWALPRAARYWQREGYRERVLEERVGLPAMETAPAPHARKGHRRG